MTSIVKYTPWSLLKDLEGGIGHLIDRNLSRYGWGSDGDTNLSNEWSPQVDVKEETDKYLITADLPGVDPKDIQVSMENNVLSIRGERKLERKVKDDSYTRTERFSGAF